MLRLIKLKSSWKFAVTMTKYHIAAYCKVWCLLLQVAGHLIRHNKTAQAATRLLISIYEPPAI